ncbi:MAG: hypothetical protein CMJ51_04665 [Planctomycetaceae bacterium]|nr:hypothetical protein [Planctomycetaceae bacterium]
MHANPLTTSFVAKLRDRDDEAWFELWTVFGPVIRAQLSRWGRGQVGAATVEDLTQDTLTALSGSIDRFDPSRGARFSTWLLSIAKHVLGDEMDRRYAQKRGSGRRATSLDESFMGHSDLLQPDDQYERLVFQAKVHAAIRAAQQESQFLHFEVYRMRVFEGTQGKEVASRLGISEPSVTRHLQRVRGTIRNHVSKVVGTYSFTRDELAEAEAAGLSGSDDLFDEAICEIHVNHTRLLEIDDSRTLTE